MGRGRRPTLDATILVARQAGDSWSSIASAFHVSPEETERRHGHSDGRVDGYDVTTVRVVAWA